MYLRGEVTVSQLESNALPIGEDPGKWGGECMDVRGASPVVMLSMDVFSYLYTNVSSSSRGLPFLL